MQWRDEAVCNRLPWEQRTWFFGEGTDLPVHEQHERARTLCYLCPVQLECLDYWLDTLEEFGIWGGLTVSQRKRYLMPVLRKASNEEEAIPEVIWTLGLRLFPKIEAAYRRAGHEAPLLPLETGPPQSVVVEILTPSMAAA